MNDFTKVRGLSDNIPLITLDKEAYVPGSTAGTTIREGALVMLDANGLAVEATATATKVAYAVAGATINDATIQVINSRDIVLEGAAAGAYSAAQKGTTVGIALTGLVQSVNNATPDTTATGILKIVPDSDVADTTGRIKVTINNIL